MRRDPYSSRRPGFEVRTYRLCHRILMFHHFEELGPGPTLISSTHFPIFLKGQGLTIKSAVLVLRTEEKDLNIPGENGVPIERFQMKFNEKDLTSDSFQTDTDEVIEIEIEKRAWGGLHYVELSGEDDFDGGLIEIHSLSVENAGSLAPSPTPPDEQAVTPPDTATVDPEKLENIYLYA